MYFYGSLRPGEYNYSRFCLDRMADIVADDVVVPGAMYSYHDAYPVVNFNRKGEVRGTILRVDDYVAEMIDGMERGAGYNPLKLEIKHGDHTIYPVTYHWPGSTKKHVAIPDGNWPKHNRVLEAEYARSRR